MLFVNLNIAIYLGYFGYKKRLIGFVVLINEEKRKLIETKRGASFLGSAAPNPRPPFSVLCSPELLHQPQTLNLDREREEETTNGTGSSSDGR